MLSAAISPKPGLQIAGIGVDLVNTLRMRRFLKEHSLTKVRRLLGPKEKKRKAKAITPVFLARIFSAKEAFFKTFNEPWFGLEGFASIDVSFLPQSRFRIRACGGVLGNSEAEGVFFREQHLLGAQVVRWEKI